MEHKYQAFMSNLVQENLWPKSVGFICSTCLAACRAPSRWVNSNYSRTFMKFELQDSWGERLITWSSGLQRVRSPWHDMRSIGNSNTSSAHFCIHNIHEVSWSSFGCGFEAAVLSRTYLLSLSTTIVPDCILDTEHLLPRGVGQGSNGV